MRILRIFKLVRHFAGLQSLIITLQQVKFLVPRAGPLGRLSVFQAYKELGLLLVLIVVAILVYSSLVYFAERDRDEVVGINCTNWKESAKLVRCTVAYIFSLSRDSGPHKPHNASLSHLDIHWYVGF